MPLIKPDGMIFDIGGNGGQSVRHFRKYTTGKIVSVEPCWQVWQGLRECDCIALMAAAWKQPGLTRVYYSTTQTGWSSLQPEKWGQAFPDAKWAPPQYVPTITIDQLKAEFGVPHCVKIDVEGSEYEVMQGMTFKVPVCIFEFHSKFPGDVRRCLDYLQGLGYSMASWTSQDWDLDTVPTQPIDGFYRQFTKGNPYWGNITCI